MNLSIKSRGAKKKQNHSNVENPAQNIYLSSFAKVVTALRLHVAIDHNPEI
jgi:hypothetical protein